VYGGGGKPLSGPGKNGTIGCGIWKYNPDNLTYPKELKDTGVLYLDFMLVYDI